MIHEMRKYVAVPGKEDALAARFRDSTLAIFDRLGIVVDGFWRDRHERGVLIYFVVWESEERMKAGWDAFRDDAEWKKVKAETERDGPLSESIESRVCEVFA